MLIQTVDSESMGKIFMYTYWYTSNRFFLGISTQFYSGLVFQPIKIENLWNISVKLFYIQAPTGTQHISFPKKLWWLFLWTLWNQTSALRKDFQRVLERLTFPNPYSSCLLTNQDGLNKFCRGSPKEHFCESILKSNHILQDKTIFKV